MSSSPTFDRSQQQLDAASSRERARQMLTDIKLDQHVDAILYKPKNKGVIARDDILFACPDHMPICATDKRKPGPASKGSSS